MPALAEGHHVGVAQDAHGLGGAGGGVAEIHREVVGGEGGGEAKLCRKLGQLGQGLCYRPAEGGLRLRFARHRGDMQQV